ncbi:hypothetical protein [Streptacidiphilus carbonis]|uniref:hypothetical protein n=1 Tax=Streptacidiphilus carbonis TaxID=105422 RepID=UPI0006944C77|nr:hypothetical protein [Streptacidiphilus carbonis]
MLHTVRTSAGITLTFVLASAAVTGTAFAATSGSSNGTHHVQVAAAQADAAARAKAQTAAAQTAAAQTAAAQTAAAKTAAAKTAAAKTAAAKAAATKAAAAKTAAANAAAAKAKAKTATQATAVTYADNLDGWIAEARAVLAADGDQVPSAASIKARAMTESSGNPGAENHWDANQSLYGGTYGLLQTIKPTFAEWSLPGHKDILNPVDSIIAGVRYANDRYGSFDTVAYTKAGY